MLHKKFSVRLSDAFAYPRCSCHLYADSGCTPGILLLGMTMWHKFNMDLYDEEVNRTASPCVNLVYSTFGSFAVAYSSGVMPFIIHWLERENLFPYDWLYTYLAQEGFVVRGLRKPVVIADLSRNSSVKKRAHEGNPDAIRNRLKIHDWEVEQFIQSN